LDGAFRCALFGLATRPAVCVSLQPTFEMCGGGRDAALAQLADLELRTAPGVIASHAPRKY